MGKIPQIGQISVHLDEVPHLRVGEAQIPDGLVERDAQGDSHRVANGVADLGDRLAGEARPVLEAAAVLVVAHVGRAAQKVLEYPEAVGAVEADQIEPGRLGAPRRVGEPAAQVADLPLRKGAGLHRIVGEGDDGARRHGAGHLPGVEIRPVDSRIGELDAREGAVFLDAFGHPGEHRDVPVVPQPQFDERRDLRGVVHLALLGEDNAPAALRLDPAHGRGRRRVAVSPAIAVRHLIEPVLRRDRTDRQRLEQDAVGGVGHSRLRVRHAYSSPGTP